MVLWFVVENDKSGKHGSYRWKESNNMSAKHSGWGGCESLLKSNMGKEDRKKKREGIYQLKALKRSEF